MGSPGRRKEKRSATRIARAVSVDLSRCMSSGVARGCCRSKARYAGERVVFMGEEESYRFARGEERRESRVSIAHPTPSRKASQRVRILAVLGEVESSVFLILVNAQPHERVRDLEQDEGAHEAVHERGDNRDHLRKELRWITEQQAVRAGRVYQLGSE